ncbi:MAG: hypothetical protein KAR47_21390 [Planctomycetes bacterium]|nr:hypothetical protein [Planctomycetota bacterium]
MTNGTGFTWGAYADNSNGDPDQATGMRIEARGSDMWFGGRATENGNYTYTIFDSTGGNTADTTVDLSGGSGTPSIDVTGFSASTSDPFTLTVMIRTGVGNWYAGATSQEMNSETSTTLSWDPLTVDWSFVAADSASNLDALTGTDEQILSFTGSGTAPALSAVDGVGILITGDDGNENFTIEHIVVSDGTAINFPPEVNIGNSNNSRNAYLLDDLDGMPEDPPRVGSAWNPNRDPNGWEPVGRSVNAVEDTEDDFNDLILTWSVIDFEDTREEGIDPQVAMDAVQFVTPGVNGFDPNAVFFYRGLYTLKLTAEDTGGAIGLSTKPVDVRENFPPSINGNTGNKNRSMYLTDIVGPHASGITSLHTSDGTPMEGWALNTNDDNYPLNVAEVTQQWRVQHKPEGSFVNFWVTSAQPGSSDRVDYYDFYSGTQDPNVTFSDYGEYTISMEVDDTDLIADPNYEATFTMVDNKRPWNYSAGPDVVANLSRGGTATLAGVVEDNGEFPLKTVWYVDEGPLGADLGAITFDPDNTALDAVVTFIEQGEYRLRLEVGDHSETLDWDANDFLTATVDPTTYARMILRPSDDAKVRGGGGQENENYGARDRLQVRDGAPGGGEHQLSYMKFDLNQIKGNIQIAELRIMSNEAQNTGDTVIFATTYGASGEWFEGDEDGDTEMYIGPGITYMKNDLVRGAELDRWQTSEGTWGSGSRRTFNVSAMTTEEDGKVTLEIFTDQSDETEDFRSKENFNTNNEPPTYRGPELIIAYDPNMPYYPSPAENAVEVLPTTDLGWRAHDSTSFEVYLSTNESLVISRDAGVSIGTVPAISATDPNAGIDPTPGIGEELAQSTRYYWAVDGDNGVEGEVWDFITVDVPVLVHPDPIGNMIIIPGRPRTDPGTDPTAQPEFYSWTGGVTATSFDLYLSTNESDVVNMVSPAATDISSPFDPNQRVVLALSNGEPGDLTYYWRIAANQASGPALVSAIGSFGADDHERIDNFNDRKPPPASQTGLSNYTGKWTAEGGATITWINNTLPGTVGVLGSSLKFDYKHISGASKAKFTFVEPRDWSTNVNRAALRLQYVGGADNDLDVVTVRITDTSGGTHTESYSSAEGGEFEQLNGGVWLDSTEVKLDLAPFDATVDMTSIKSYSLGVGDGSTATGTIYFDGIQIFSTHCASSKYSYIFSGGDCDVDVNELSVMAERWMAESVTVNAGTVPTDNLMLYFPFQGSLDSDTFSGTVSGTLNEHKNSITHITTDGAPTGGGQCIRVDRGDRLEWADIPSGTLGAANPSATVSIWVKGDDITSFDLQDNGRMNRLEVFKFRATRYPDGEGNQTFMELTIPENDGAITMVLNSFLDGENNQNHSYSGFNTQPSDWQNEWNHIAFVWDGVSGVTSFYLNGLMIDREGYWPSDADDKVEAFMGERINRIRVPDWRNNSTDVIGGYDGLIDEFRLYSRVLTHEEIVALANQASVEQHVIGNAPDVDDDGNINMVDMAELGANYHRTNVLWP